MREREMEGTGRRQTPARADVVATSRARARAVLDAIQEVRRRSGADAVIARRTRGGEIHIRTVEERVSGRGVTYLDIHLDGAVEGGDPHFRVVNLPPSDDPLQTLANVLAQHGGVSLPGGRKRR